MHAWVPVLLAFCIQEVLLAEGLEHSWTHCLWQPQNERQLFKGEF